MPSQNIKVNQNQTIRNFGAKRNSQIITQKGATMMPPHLLTDNINQQIS